MKWTRRDGGRAPAVAAPRYTMPVSFISGRPCGLDDDPADFTLQANKEERYYVRFAKSVGEGMVKITWTLS